MISSSQRPLPDNTQYPQQTDIHAPGGIQTHGISRRAAVDLRLRRRGHWDWCQATLPPRKNLGTHWIGGWLGPRTCGTSWRIETFLASIEKRTPGSSRPQPDRCTDLSCRLCCRDSQPSVCGRCPVEWMIGDGRYYITGQIWLTWKRKYQYWAFAKPAVVLTDIPSVVPLLHVTARPIHRAGTIGPSLLVMLISIDQRRYCNTDLTISNTHCRSFVHYIILFVTTNLRMTYIGTWIEKYRI